MVMTTKPGYKSKRRNTGIRTRKNVILMSAEGKNKTETQYFTDMARELNLNIRFSGGNYTDPKNMVVTLQKKYKELGLEAEQGDKAFCLVDSDVDPKKNEQLAKADFLSQKGGTVLIVSSPCFEVWCLCHFGCNSTHFNNSAAVVEELSKKLPEYSKSGKGLYKRLSPKTKIAIKNAKIMEKNCRDAGYQYHTVDFSPSSEIYRVIESILP